MANVILQAPNCDSPTVFNKLQIQQITIPPDLPSILKRYAKAAIRTQPHDLLVWSAAYFKALSSGIPPPVKERIEYPPVIIASGLTPGFLKVLINQVGREEAKVVPKSTVVERWTDICLSRDALNEILNVGGFHKDTIAWLKFVAICAGYLESRLSRTMVLLIELLSTEPEEKVPAVPVKKFLMLYRFLAAMDCGPVDQRRSTTCDVSSLATEVSPVAGHITSTRTPEESEQVLDEHSVEPAVNKQTIENEIESEVVNNGESKSNKDNLVNEDNLIEVVENDAEINELSENKMETVDISGIESEGNGSVSEAPTNAVEAIAAEEEKSNVESVVTSESDSSNLEENKGPVAVNLLEEIDDDLKEAEVTKEEHENSSVNSGEDQITVILEEEVQKSDNLESKNETSSPQEYNEDIKEEEEEKVETGDEAHHQEVSPDTKDETPICETEETEESGEEAIVATANVQEEELSAVLIETENGKKVGSPTSQETAIEGEENVDSRSGVEEFHDAIHETKDDTENLSEKTVEDEQKNEKNMNEEIKEEELQKDTEESTELGKVGEQSVVSEKNNIGEFHEVKRNEDKIEEVKNVEYNNESSKVETEKDDNELKETNQGSEHENFGESPNYPEKVIECADMVSNEDEKKDENEECSENELEKAETEEVSRKEPNKEENEEYSENEPEKAETEEAPQKEQNKEENEEYPANEPEKAETEEASHEEQNEEYFENEPEKAETEEGSQEEQTKEENKEYSENELEKAETEEASHEEQNEEYFENEPEKAETEKGSQEEQTKEENEEYSENEPEKAESEEVSQKEQNIEEIEEYPGNEPEKAETEEGSQKEENEEENKESSEKAEIEEEDIVTGTETNIEHCIGFQEEEEVQKEEISSGYAGREAEKSPVAVVEEEETQETEQVTPHGKGDQDKSEYKELANKENYFREGQINDGIMGAENDENEKQTPVEDQNDNALQKLLKLDGNQIEIEQDREVIQASENMSMEKGFDRPKDIETDKFSEQNYGKENTSVLEIDSTETEKSAIDDVDSKEDREESKSDLKDSDGIRLENIESLNVDSIKDLEEKPEEVTKTSDQFVKAEEENDSVVEDSSVNRLNETEATVEDTTGEIQQPSEGTEEKSAVDNDGANEVIMSGSVNSTSDISKDEEHSNVKKVECRDNDDETIAYELIQVIHTSGNEHINRYEETGVNGNREDSDETNIADEYNGKNDEIATKPDNEEEENEGMVSGDDINSEDSTFNERKVIKDKKSSEQINDLESSNTDAHEKIEETENINGQAELDPVTSTATSPSNIQEVTDPTENENNLEESKTEQRDNETEEKEDKQSITGSSVVKENSVETQNSFDETEGILQEDVISLQQANLESVPEAKSNLIEGELNEEAESIDKRNSTVRGEETLDEMLYLVDNYKEDSQSKGDVNDNLTDKIEEVEIDQALNSVNESEEDQLRRSDHLKSESSARSGRSRFAGVVKSGAEWSTQPAYYAYVPGIGPPVPEERIGRNSLLLQERL
ncbi:uncharacterized protein isoform X2 [Rhodnius prolixus]|uniref:uncharacterized protein isoform X2 n=1 Tax=Rhodnius prolixus TaxID=13249 RepID=UPI003D189843